jgi:hypothetical protein
MAAKKKPVSGQAQKHFNATNEYVSEARKKWGEGDRQGAEEMWNKADEEVRKGLESM